MISRKQKPNVTPSYFPYHFGTSGISVAAATGVTHPIGLNVILYLGLTPAITRSVLHGGLRLGSRIPNPFSAAKGIQDKIVLTEGPIALYKGGFTIFARLGPQTAITFVVCEKLQEIAGLKAI